VRDGRAVGLSDMGRLDNGALAGVRSEDKEASQTRDYCVAKKRDAARGSPRSLVGQNAPSSG